MPKAVQLPLQEEHLKWCKEARVQNAEALREYQFGGKRRYVNKVDVTLGHIASLCNIIRDLDQQIAELEKNL